MNVAPASTKLSQSALRFVRLKWQNTTLRLCGLTSKSYSSATIAGITQADIDAARTYCSNHLRYLLCDDQPRQLARSSPS